MKCQELHPHRLIGADLGAAVLQHRRIDAAAAAGEPQHADVAGDEAHQQNTSTAAPNSVGIISSRRLTT